MAWFSGIRSLRAIAAASNRERLLWAVRVRWLAISGFSLLALLAWRSGVLAALKPCLIAGAASALVNAANHAAVRRWRYVRAVTALAIPADVVLITYLIVHSGGVRSPFIMLYVVQVVATAILVDLGIAAFTALASAVCFVAALWLGVGVAAPGAWSADRPTDQLVFGLFLLYSLGLLTYLGGYIAARLRRSEDDLAQRNESLQTALGWLERTNADLQRTVDRLRTTEAQLVQSEKLRALGQFVAGVAHELNNPIGFVTANLDFLGRAIGAMQRLLSAYAAVPLDGTVREAIAAEQRAARLDELVAEVPSALADCTEGARRAAEIVSGLRAFARGDPDGRWSHADLAERLERTLGLLRHRFGADVSVERDYGSLPPVECLAGQLDQVWLNVIGNAADAVAGRGRLVVSTRMHIDPPVTPRAGPHAVVSIRDDGPGMAPDVRARLFEPFFTTKPEGQGIGLGLSVSYGIVERHGGVITVASAPGEGSTFTIYLPLRQESVAAGVEARAPAAAEP